MPYTIGLESACNSFASAGLPTQFTCAIAALLIIIPLVSSLQEQAEDAPICLPGNAVSSIFPFFRRRFDFLNWGFYFTQAPIFQFKLLGHSVIAVSGEKGRATFFSAKSLDLTEGFKILSGAIPMIPGVTSGLHHKRVQLIHKRLAAVQKSDHITDLIPVISKDCGRIMEGWGKTGTFDPFDKIYELMFSITVRSLTGAEISDNFALVSRLKKLYDKLDSGTTPASVLIPWLATPAMVQKLWATKNIYDIVSAAVNSRRETSKIHRRNDTLQMLVDSGDDKLVAIGFIMGLLIASARSTGTTASWLVTFIGSHPEWQAKARAELQTLLDTHSLDYEPSSDINTLASHLGTIPLDAWESETPVIDLLIRETLRLAEPHTAMRKNIGPPLYIDGKLIPTGAYVVYPFSDVHLNPKLYPDPWKFDPNRPEKSFIGWGTGRTACLGTRLAKIELKVFIANMLLGFSHVTINKSGTNAVPVCDWNDILACRPLMPAYIEYKRSGATL